MSLIRIANPDAIRPGHVVMIALIVLTLAGSCLLYSGVSSTALPDGAREWPANSLFRPLVALLNLNYAHPTPAGADVKTLVFGLGVASAVACLAVALVLRPRSGEEIDESDTIIVDPTAQDRGDDQPARKHIQPLFAAQVLMLLYVGWSFASVGWSDAGDIAFYGSAELAIGVLWAFSVAYGLSRASARFGAYALVAVAAVTALIAVGYHVERNPTLRASFPIGNPTFLAACLIPSLLVAACVLVAQIRDFGNPRRARRAVVALVCAGVLVVMWFAFRGTDSRGAYAGLGGGFLALFFFAFRKHGKLVVLTLSVICAVMAAWWYLPRTTDYSPTGRDASFRLRCYAWGYGLDLVGERKLLGHGQGGYVRKADARAAGEDVLNDPEALTARIAHAHNEWMEVWADLGSVGLVLIAGALFMTLAGGAGVVWSLPTVIMRWVLIALLASLTALIVEEMSGVGLRVTGLPPIYYTVIGLIWAFGMREQPAAVRALCTNKLMRAVGVVVAGFLAFGAAYVSVRDFDGARSQYQVAGAVNNLEWERAVELASTARDRRLSPQRRLVAQEQLSATCLHIAHVYQVNGLRRAATATRSEPHDQQLLALANQNIKAAGFYWDRGWENLMDLFRKAPNFYNSNWLQYRFQQVRAEFARVNGELEKARKSDRQSSEALKAEIARRPYDINMAADYVVAAGSVISLEEMCSTLARPLRYRRVPVFYHDIASRLVAVSDFAREFLPVYELARSINPADDPSHWLDALAPETLRLAAVIRFAEGRYDLAEESLEHACALYVAIEPRFAYGAAACFSELAEHSFLNDPLEPARAIAAAEEAIKRAPPSNEGRQLVRMVRSTLVGMQLANGDETAARATLLESEPDSTAFVVREVLSISYSDLISTLMRRDGEIHLDILRRWADRAVELDQDNEFAWRQKADIAFREQRDTECVRCLREASQRGAADDVIYRFVDIALQHRPTSKPLLDYSAELATELEKRAPSQND